MTGYPYLRVPFRLHTADLRYAYFHVMHGLFHTLIPSWTKSDYFSCREPLLYGHLPQRPIYFEKFWFNILILASCHLQLANKVMVTTKETKKTEGLVRSIIRLVQLLSRYRVERH